jgi:hypothetical protein
MRLERADSGRTTEIFACVFCVWFVLFAMFCLLMNRKSQELGGRGGQMDVQKWFSSVESRTSVGVLAWNILMH